MDKRARSQVEEHMTFWIDDAAKAFVLSNGQRLRISRFDKSWISASSEDIQYEFNRADARLPTPGQQPRIASQRLLSVQASVKMRRLKKPE